MLEEQVEVFFKAKYLQSSVVRDPATLELPANTDLKKNSVLR